MGRASRLLLVRGMRKRALGLCCVAVAVLVGNLWSTARCFSQTQKEAIPNQAESLKSFLQNYLGKPNAAVEREGATRYSSALVDLKDDGTKEVIVYISGRAWCGSGGCVALILAPEGKSYRVVTETTVTRLPIRILSTMSNGWHDIGVVVAGGGIQPGYEAILSFDGKSYPSNPTVPPAHRSSGEIRGEIVLTVTAEEQTLYQ
jgi:hypothetical protein